LGGYEEDGKKETFGGIERGANEAMSQGITVRKCKSLEEFHRCVELQREVWGEAELEVEPITVFVVAAHTGGQVLGAFDGDRMVGYTLAVVGLRNRVAYLHSHMTGVQSEYRNRGVGRMLKLFQRDEALSRGIRLVEWTFDPLELRNAHFNLNRLGAICREYQPNLYGVTTSPLHRGLATDRLVAEWHLDSAHVVAAIENLVKDPVEAPASIEVPAELERWQREDSSQAGNVQARLREEFTRWFAKGYAAVGLRTSRGNRAYLLTPWSDF
jgi:predicted GNAT superfamily acetyltransferase